MNFHMLQKKKLTPLFAVYEEKPKSGRTLMGFYERLRYERGNNVTDTGQLQGGGQCSEGEPRTAGAIS
jgi:hypothetical protein